MSWSGDRDKHSFDSWLERRKWGILAEQDEATRAWEEAEQARANQVEAMRREFELRREGMLQSYENEVRPRLEAFEAKHNIGGLVKDVAKALGRGLLDILREVRTTDPSGDGNLRTRIVYQVNLGQKKGYVRELHSTSRPRPTDSGWTDGEAYSVDRRGAIDESLLVEINEQPEGYNPSVVVRTTTANRVGGGIFGPVYEEGGGLNMAVTKTEEPGNVVQEKIETALTEAFVGIQRK